ncbi:hypothetical protein [Novosphingobium panipatense]|uniref:hypothetical protein n=1 Tax=Novosphingobium panipatense TaxID=428991 RepID=UPI00360BB536
MQSIVATDPQVATRLQQLGGAYGKVVSDPTLRSAQGAATLSQQVTREANVLAFNDIFMLVGFLAAFTLVWMGAKQVRMYITGFNPMAEPLAAMARMRAQ